MKVRRLTKDAQLDLFETIIMGLQAEANRDLEYTTQLLVDMLDDTDMEDAWGTEGWKHRFGVEA